ncbi:MAG: SDR family oxidoreductase [Thermoplasmata archaeon]|nr:SDR family oxidoreductase [Thermoplasmata archaeon]
MKNKIILITGATSGIGTETARDLAKLGATVVFTTRDELRGKQIQEELMKTTNNNNIDVLFCDLASFDSIKACCAEFKQKYDRLDVLINNAAIWDHTRRESKDGIENIFATNHLAPFLMTSLLFDILKKSRPSRIINLTSGLHYGTINFEDIEFKHGFKGIKAYRQSKLAIILFTRLLATKLKGTSITVNCVHPGMNKTNLARDAGPVSRTIFKFISKSPTKGAETSIYLASSLDVQNITGEYFAKNQISKSSKQSYDMKLAERLWKLSEEYIGSKFKIE